MQVCMKNYYYLSWILFTKLLIRYVSPSVGVMDNNQVIVLSDCTDFKCMQPIRSDQQL